MNMPRPDLTPLPCLDNEFRLLGWYGGLRSYAEWSRNSRPPRPNTYERCRELMRNNMDKFFCFEIQEKSNGGRWKTVDLFIGNLT